MANENLFPTDFDSDIGLIASSDETITGYKKAPYFDSTTGDFILDGSGTILDADGVEAYTQWCEAVVATDRYNHDAYSSDIGIDYNLIFSAKTHEEAETLLESEISEALAVDPYHRTKYVKNVLCKWIGPESINVTIEVLALDNELVTIDTVIKL